MSFSTRIPAAATVLGTAFLLACTGPASAADPGGIPYGEHPGETGTQSLHAKPHGMLGKRMRFAGTAAPGSTVAIQRLGHNGWVTEATATAGREGEYLARWRTDTIGVLTMRAVPSSGGSVRASAAESTIEVTVFRPANATWYGPGFYGRKTACGKTMSRTLMGVAHKTLPCGTKVAFLYEGRTITVPVVDRGPYSGDFSWDLTSAAAQQLGFEHSDALGAVSIRPR